MEVYMVNWIEIDNQAKKWIKEAGQFIRNSFSKTLEIQTKSNPNDLVTEVDKKTEQFFINKIRDAYPDHKIVGEEGFGDKLASMDGIVWVIDPIDGTMNFVHMQRNFAISIGIYENGIGQIGLIYDVVLDELYHSRKDHGAYLNNVALKPLEKRSISESIIGMNATWVTKNSRINPEILAALVYDLRGTRSYGSAALEFAYVASGRLDGHISLRLSPWDFAAGKIMVEELGGIVTDLRGNKVDLLKQNSIIMAKPGVHESIMNKYLQNGQW
jgi:myo-inositol-1(or 4)-monophosphatase